MSRARITAASTALVIALTACAPPPAPEVVETTLTVTSTQTETSTAPPPPPSAAQRVPDDLRAKVASLIVVGVANYDQARFCLLYTSDAADE